MYEVSFSKSVVKFIDKKGIVFKNKVIEKFKILRNDPYTNLMDIKPLKGKSSHFRLRIGKYRFLYEVFENVLLIYCYDADSRGDIYKK